MANLTVTVDDQILRRARMKAIEHGTSVNAVVSQYLQRYAGVGETATALNEFLEMAGRVDAASGPGGRSWRREDLYDRPVFNKPR
jgi:plasmid stability protein